MSIIHEALKKTQDHLFNHHNEVQHHKDPSGFPWLDVSLITVILMLGALVAFAYYPKFTHHAMAFNTQFSDSQHSLVAGAKNSFLPAINPASSLTTKQSPTVMAATTQPTFKFIEADYVG